MKWGSAKLLDKEIRRLRLDENLTLSEISKKLGASPSTIHRRIQEMKLPTRPRTGNWAVAALKEMGKEELESLYSSMTSHEIAEVIGCNPATVNRTLARKGIQRRQTKGWLNLRLRVSTTIAHKFFAWQLVQQGVDLRFDWINYPVEVADDCLFFIDIAIPDVKIGIEIDGESHKGNEGLDEDRDELLKICGWRMIHLNHQEAYLNGEETASTIAEVITSAGSKAILTRVPGNLQKVG